MRLTDLDPRWLLKDGRRVGFVFISPTQDRPARHDGSKSPPWRQSCFPQPTPHDVQRAIFEEMFADDDFTIQGCNPACGWKIEGGIENATFETMTVTPSLDGSAGGLWHGFITNGEIR